MLERKKQTDTRLYHHRHCITHRMWSIRVDDMDNKSFRLALLASFCCLHLARNKARGETTTCRLASQILGNKQRVCVFIGANNTQYREYLPYDAGECPRDINAPTDQMKNLLI